MKFRSIGGRIVVATAMVAAIASVVFASIVVVRDQSLTEAEKSRRAEVSIAQFALAVEAEQRQLALSAVSLATLPPLREALAKGDREAVLALLRDSQPAVAAVQPGPRVNVHRAPAIAFVRVWNPSAHGDDIAARRRTVTEAGAPARCRPG